MSNREGDGSRRTPDAAVRECPDCGRRSEHEVSILVEEETTRADVRDGNAKFSRHPSLVYRCPSCGHATRERT